MEEAIVQSSLSGDFEVRLPAVCPCCCAPVTDPKARMVVTASFEDWAPSGAYLAPAVTFPYCRTCVNHAHGLKSGQLPFLALVAMLFFVWLPAVVVAADRVGALGVAVVLPLLLALTVPVLRWLLRQRREARSLAAHAVAEGLAVEIWRKAVGDKVRFRFASAQYAVLFREANADRLVS